MWEQAGKEMMQMCEAERGEAGRVFISRSQAYWAVRTVYSLVFMRHIMETFQMCWITADADVK